MRHYLLFGFAFLLLCNCARAQSSDRFEIFGGYSYLSGDFTTVTNGGVNGWNASLNAKVKPWVGVVADFSAYYPNENFGCPSLRHQCQAVHLFVWPAAFG